MDIDNLNDGNSIVEVYLEYLHKNVPNGIKFEPIGYIPIFPNFKVYIASNNKLRYFIIGTDFEKLADRRFKDYIKLCKHSTFLIYPTENYHQKINKINYKEINEKILEVLSKDKKEKDEFNITPDINEILNYLKMN